MKSTDIPKLMSVPFGINGQREDLLASPASGDNTASYSGGFPSLTMIDLDAGGKPPKGQDFNQILYELANGLRWSNAGRFYQYDSTWSTANSGYPTGSILLSTDNQTLYISSVDDNTTDPDSSSSSGWVNISSLGLVKSLGLQTEARSNLGLGTAALASIGTDSGNIPDMSSFTVNGSSGVFSSIVIAGQKRLMEGNGKVTFSGGVASFTLPLSYPSTSYTFIATDVGTGTESYAANPSSGSIVTIYGRDASGNLLNASYSFKYISLGSAS